MNIEKVFSKVPRFKNISLDKVLFESKYTVMFTCKNDNDIYCFKIKCTCNFYYIYCLGQYIMLLVFLLIAVTDYIFGACLLNCILGMED